MAADERAPTFTHEVKNELANRSFEAAELPHLLAGYLFLVRARPAAGGAVVTTDLASLAKMVYSAMKKIYRADVHIAYSGRRSSRGAKIFALTVRDSEDFRLDELRASVASHFDSYLKTAAVRPFMTGLFLASGSLLDPERGYFLEISFKGRAEAEKVAQRVAGFSDERHMDFKVIARRTRYVMYLKKSEQIANFLAFIGAPIAMLNFENARLTRDFTNNEHRLDVCTYANYQRALKTGRKNLDDIELVESKIGLGAQDEKTRLLIALRKEFIDASYLELAEQAEKKGWSISKSTVAHTFKALADLADRLRS